jgi:hypothetical protein
MMTGILLYNELPEMGRSRSDIKTRNKNASPKAGVFNIVVILDRKHSRITER